MGISVLHFSQRRNFQSLRKKVPKAITFSPRSLREQAKSSSNPPSSPSCLDWTQWGFLLRWCMTSDSDCHVKLSWAFSGGRAPFFPT